MIRKTLLRLALVAIVTSCAVAIAWMLPTPSVKHDPPRALPWQVPDHNQADKRYEYLPDGRIRVITHHLPLPGITPAMLSWFYQHLPTSTVNLNGTTYPLYHLFHPTEHGRLWVDEAADSAMPGMTQGAVIVREEWFGKYDSRGKARITEFSEKGFTAVAYVVGLEVGVVQHRFTVAAGETHYVVHATMGSTLPVLGSLLNAYLKDRVFTEGMMDQWMRHQVEEVGSLVHFLPQLYQQRSQGNHFTIVY